jgi:hypothetical protein
MNKTCVSVPYIDVIIFYIFFIILIPAIIIKRDPSKLSYYMSIVLGLAVLLVNYNPDVIKNNLYDENSKDTVTILSTNFLLLVTIIGLLWRTVVYGNNTNIIQTIGYGAIIYVTYVQLMKGMSFAINKIDNILNIKTDDETNISWHRILIGTCYFIILIILQHGLLKLLEKVSITKLYANNKAIRNIIKQNVSLSSINSI